MSTRPPFSDRIYRLLMRAYPRRFREQFGRDLLHAFGKQRDEPEYQGLRGGARFWVEIGLDWMRTVVVTRRAHARQRVRHPRTTSNSISTREAVVDGLKQDLAFAVRSLTRAPGFAFVAVLTLAIGIGSNAAIFGVVKSVLMEPLPYDDPDGVVTIWSSWVGFPDKTWVSLNEYRLYLNAADGFDDLATWNETNVTFTDPSRPERVLGAITTENLTSVLGVEMALGRYFRSEEALQSDSLPSTTIVISHEVWVRRFASDPGVVGSLTEVNGRQREIVGVMPAGFRLPTHFGSFEVADVFFPTYVPRTMVTDFPEGGGSHGNYVVGRLTDGISVDEGKAQIERAIDQVHAEFGAYPPERNFRPIVLSAADDVFGAIRPALLALLGTVAFVLLIACANVANLMLARSEDRADELAVRTALGARRGRLVRQLLVESLVVASIGGATGGALAVGGVRLFKALNPGNLPRIDDVALDGGVLIFAAVVTVGTALLFGTLPALRVTGQGLRSRMSSRGARGVGRSGWQGTLVAVEMSLAVVLVVGAGLMVRTFEELTSIEPGFEAASVLTLGVSLPATRYPDPGAATDFWREAIRQSGELPSVTSASAIRSLPLASPIGDWGLDIEGYDESVNPRANGDWQIAAPGYFETLGIPLLEGRDFDWNDDESGTLVGIVNETFVRRYWPDVEPVGRTFIMGTADRRPITVVGVVGDVTHNGLISEIKPKFYIPVAQWGPVTRGTPTSLRLVIRTAGEPEELVAPAREMVRALDPSLAVAEVFSIDDVLSNAVAQPRFVVVLMGAFSAIALILAMVGVYGVVSYGVGKRTQEIGVRIALGAERHEVVGLMAQRAASIVGIGLIAGLVLAFSLSRYLESLLYGVTATDPFTFAIVAIGFAAVAALATWVPSRRAAGIDPIQALRME